jgi:hypothetical protein
MRYGCIAGLLLAALAACSEGYTVVSLDPETGGDPVAITKDAGAKRDTGTDARIEESKIDAATDAIDASIAMDAGPDVSSEPATLNVGAADCNGGHCGGGYGDVKDVNANRLTARKVCADKGYSVFIDYTLGGQPGGKFCGWSGSAWGCDPSCSGCNAMTTISCKN